VSPGLETEIAQESLSFNRHRGTVRGLHFQRPPHEDTKKGSCPNATADRLATRLPFAGNSRQRQDVICRRRNRDLPAANVEQYPNPPGIVANCSAKGPAISRTGPPTCNLSPSCKMPRASAVAISASVAPKIEHNEEIAREIGRSTVLNRRAWRTVLCRFG
jgi:hypothetical protein